MYENWGKDRYNPTYNYYGETDQWLSERAISSGKTSHYTPASSHRGRYFSFGYTGLFNPEKIGCQLSSESLAERHESFSIIGIEYLLNNSMEKSVYALLIGYDWGYALHPLFQPYFGGAAGINWTDSFSDGDIGFSWKICGGIRFSFSFFCIRAEISYSEILREAGTVCVGLHF
jgi:hypothetical protein